MKKKIFTLTVLASLSLLFKVNAQIPSLQWSKSYGGSGYDFITSVHELNDGSVVFGGYTSSNDNQVSGNHGGYDFWLVKLNASGNLLWSKCYGGSGDETLNDMQVTSTGNFIMTGRTTSNNTGQVSGYHGNTDAWVVIADSAGNFLNQKCLGGSGLEAGNAIAVDNEGNFLIAAGTSSSDGDVTTPPNAQDAWLVKLDGSLNKLWDVTKGGVYSDYASDVIQRSNGQYAFSVYYECCGGDGSDVYIYLLSSNGTVQNTWIDAAPDNFDFIINIIEKPNGEILCGGNNYDFDQSDIEALSFSASGTKLWKRFYYQLDSDNYEEQNDGCVSILSNGNLVFAATDDPTASGTLILADSAGNFLEDKHYGGSGVDHLGHSETNSARDVLYAVGYTYSSDGDLSGNYGLSDGWVLKLSDLNNSCDVPSNLHSINIAATNAVLDWNDVSSATSYRIRYKVTGTNVWQKTSSQLSQKKIKPLIPNTSYVVQVGSKCSNPSQVSDWTPAFHFTTPPQRLELESNQSQIKLDIYPNPLSELATMEFSLPEISAVEISLFDLNGRQITTIATGNFASGNHKMSFDARSIPAGVYLIRFATNNTLNFQKIVIQ